MNITKLFADRTDRSDRTIPGQATRTVHSRGAVEDKLRAEHARADRTGRTFCCVLFRWPTTEPIEDSWSERLFGLLDRRSRVTDEIGWFDSSSICVILPETDELNANRFAADILASLSREGERLPVITVYAYEMTSRSPESGSTGGQSDTRRKGGSSRSEIRQSMGHGRKAAVLAMESLFRVPLSFGKRALDIVGAGFALLLFSPLMLAIALIIKASEPQGAVFFRQTRAGLGGKPFTILKFRTMSMDAEKRKESLRAMSEQDGPAFKLTADPRVTPIGRFLRKTSLDELPQLANVLSGDMSLVGPRPPTFDEVEKYKQWYRRRLTVTPGITCIWQVEGRSSVTFEQWMRMDAQYVRRSSFWLDVKLLARTVPAVLLRRGAC